MEKENNNVVGQNVKKRKRYNKTDVHYVDGKELREELQAFADSGYVEYSVKLCEMLKLMCERFSLRPNYIGYSYRDEMVEDAFIRCLQQLHKIDLNHPRSNPFCYITFIIDNSMKATIKKEKKYQELKEVLTDRFFGELTTVESINIANNNNK